MVSRLIEILRGSTRVLADETTVPPLDLGRGRIKTGYFFWAVARDDRPWAGLTCRGVIYSYAPGRGQEHNHRLLGPTAASCNTTATHGTTGTRSSGSSATGAPSSTTTASSAPDARASCRKRPPFARSDEGGANWAHVASLVGACKRNGVNPQSYVTDLLTRLVHGCSQARIDELMPWIWPTAKAG